MPQLVLHPLLHLPQCLPVLRSLSTPCTSMLATVRWFQSFVSSFAHCSSFRIVAQAVKQGIESAGGSAQIFQ